MNANTRRNAPPAPQWYRPMLGGAAAALLALAVAGCDLDSVLQVDQPFTVTPPTAQDPANLPTAFAGALREFSRAYGGVQNEAGGIILHSGTLADEVHSSSTDGWRQDIDQRNITEINGTLAVDYQRIHLARNLTEQVAALYAASGQARSGNHAELLNLAGYTYIWFGENYCGAVPFSTLAIGAGETVFGTPNTTPQIFERAQARFTEAAQFAQGAQLNLSRLGQARALLNLGRFNEAATAVAQVPTNFVYEVSYSATSTATHNPVFQMMNGAKHFSVWGPESGPTPGEGVNGLPYADPRTPKTGVSPGFNALVRHYGQLKYPSVDANIPLATGVEARLIEAEAALRANTIPTFVNLHNQARAQAGLAPVGLADVQAMTERQREDLHFRERAYHMWLTASRLGDLRRLVRQYNRQVDEVYPIGRTSFGAPYGDHVNLRIPFAERNNPNYNPAACSPTIP